ncbi:class I SAM-dependent methyltransferase [Picosynechococcus sp. PCC 11901]|uniref:class I SAM-dependent methyltransferase n=1 Tax=Picosynechococcus sp. PCC 11901 TaxID=2579791 RepID=UPI0010FBFA59|nr:methyltransferase domain-containing protein [Picosynechococcus sp. PCC 11901]QCS49042.1 class I SAM-dependent methyltransferase [Picosynechococcus sp. PCC 11901]
MGIGKKINGSTTYFRDEYILDKCLNKTVLHVGCTDFPFFKESLNQGFLLHEKVNQVAQKVIGIDIAQSEVQEMQSHGYDVRLFDAQKMSTYQWKEKFDVVLLGDVIEHIPNIGLVIEESIKMLSQDGIIVITVPNAFGIIRFLKSFFKYEQVHPDHLVYFSSGTLETLAERFDLKVREMAWYRFEARDPRLTVKVSAFLERI